MADMTVKHFMTNTQKLEFIIEELTQLAIDAEDCDVLGVAHKIREASGPLTSALVASQQADETDGWG